jgi:hypothetical protein
MALKKATELWSSQLLTSVDRDMLFLIEGESHDPLRDLRA